MGRLTDLPPEVIILVLQNLSSPRNLRLAIRAASLLYRVFLEHESAIGAAIGHGAFHEATLPLAVSVCRANLEACDVMRQRILQYPECSYPPYTVQVYKAYKKEMANFIFRGMRSRERLPSDPKILGLSLYRLWRIVDWCSKDYARQASAYVKGRMPGARAKESIDFGKIDLSDNEYYRLQRGFLFFELYRRLFGCSSMPKSACHDMWAHKKKLEFLNSIFPSMKRELWSVYSYLKSRMLRAFDEIDDYLMLILKKMKDIPCEGHSPHRYIDCVDLPSARWFIFNSARMRETRADFLLELGLPFCVHFFTKDIRGQASLALQHVKYRCLEPLGHALKRAIGFTMYPGECYNLLTCMTDAIELPYSGYSPGRRENVPEMLKFPVLALSGCYFWDEERIRRTNFKSPRSDVIRSLRRRKEAKRWRQVLKDMCLRRASLSNDENKVIQQHSDPYYNELEELEY